MFIKGSHILTSHGFLISLSLLLINDFYLKLVLNGQFTSKVSDFAGLFAFTLFWIAVFPESGRTICVLVAGAFFLWKSVYSQPVLDLWNRLDIIRISRTVDLTDLIAVPMIPFAYLYGIRERPEKRVRKWTVALIALVSIFAFTATSFRTRFDYENKYYFQGSRVDLFNKIDDLHLTTSIFHCCQKPKSLEN